MCLEAGGLPWAVLHGGGPVCSDVRLGTVRGIAAGRPGRAVAARYRVGPSTKTRAARLRGHHLRPLAPDRLTRMLHALCGARLAGRAGPLEGAGQARALSPGDRHRAQSTPRDRDGRPRSRSRTWRPGLRRVWPSVRRAFPRWRARRGAATRPCRQRTRNAPRSEPRAIRGADTDNRPGGARRHGSAASTRPASTPTRASRPRSRRCARSTRGRRRPAARRSAARSDAPVPSPAPRPGCARPSAPPSLRVPRSGAR